MATFRNPFDRLSMGNSFTPKPKKFQMPNMGESDNNRIFGGGRGHQLFQDYQPPEPSGPPEQREPGSDWSSYLSEMQDIYTKQGPAASAYKQHLETLPDYQKPSGWHRFGSALVGAAEGLTGGAAAGWTAGQAALTSPYRRAVEQWGLKEQALGRNAEIEDESSGRRLAFMKEARNMAKDESDYRRAMNEFDLKVRNQDMDEKYKLAQIKNWEAQGFVKDYDKAGNIIFINPKTGETQSFGPSSKVRDWANDDQRIKQGWASVETGRTNARTAQGNLVQTTRNQDRLDQREDRLDSAPISPEAQSTARASAISRAATSKKEWFNFVDEAGNLNPREGAKDPAQWNAFLEEVKRQENSIFSRRRPPMPREHEY